MRYFLFYNDRPIKYFGYQFNNMEVYSENLILPETGQKLGELIDFWMESNLNQYEFIQVENINNSIGLIISALKNACEIRGLNVEITISSK